VPLDQPLHPERDKNLQAEITPMANATIKRAKPTPPEYLQRIGKVTASFAMLEQTLSFFIWGLISNDPIIGQIVTAELRFKNLLSLLSSLGRHRTKNEKRIKELDDWIKRAMKVEEKRNVICHSIWGAGEAPNSITRIKTTAKISKGLRRQFEQTTVDDLDFIVNEIRAVSEDLNNVMTTSQGKWSWMAKE
jgi:hypothetical protein